MGINIKANGQQLPHLYIEKLYLVGSENFEGTLLGILFHGFDDVGCYFPFRTSAL